MVRGKGVYLYDKAGNEYIDAAGGASCVNIGHGVEEVAEVMEAQAKKLAFITTMLFQTEEAYKLAEKIAEFTPSGLKTTYMVSGGSEAVESAVKLSRQYHLENGSPGKYKIISRWHSFHGNTLGALMVTGHVSRRKPYLPMMPNTPHIPPAYCYRCPYHKEPDTCDLECAWELEKTIKVEGEEYVSAFFAEPIVGAANAACVPHEDYFGIIREVCDKYDVLFVVDEVMTGFGRTGKNFGVDNWGITPDLMTIAKGMAAAYTPLGGVVAHNKVVEVFEKAAEFVHGHTYGGNPLSSVIGHAVLTYVQENNLVENSKKVGEYLKNGLAEMAEDHTIIGDVRGRGLMIGLEFVKDKATKEPMTAPGIGASGALLNTTMNHGLIVYPGAGQVDGRSGDQCLITPPLNMTKEEADMVIDRMDLAITDIEKGM